MPFNRYYPVCWHNLKQDYLAPIRMIFDTLPPLCHSGLHSRMPFPGNRIFSKKSGKFPVSITQDQPLPVPSNSRPATSCPSRLSPEFKILYFNSQNLVLLGNFLVGIENRITHFTRLYLC